MQYVSFWNYLNNHEVEIPIIQRDYAQGRPGKEWLRKNFLTDLKRALDMPPGGTVLKLDFVYGSEEEGKMLPLDGQQRLTTLWLLHWYVALRSGNLKGDNCKVFRHFTYSTRVSSRDFCERLCNPDSFKAFKAFSGKGIKEFIERQTWFYAAWKQDPTVKSMLNMLSGTPKKDNKDQPITDGLEELFAKTEEQTFRQYWNRLVSDDAPIVFYHLALKDFGLTDDLYVKMNARGKPLTAFENFKADLIGYIRTRADEETGPEKAAWKALLDAKDGIPIKLDTVWTDVFWKYRSVGARREDGTVAMSHQIDDIFLAFIDRFFWDALFTETDASGEYLLPVGKGLLDGTPTNVLEEGNSSYRYLNGGMKERSYSDLDPYKFKYKEISLALLQKLAKVLDRLSAFQEDIPSCTWEEFHFIPQYVKESDYNKKDLDNSGEEFLVFTTLNQRQRIVFHALVKYFSEDCLDDPQSLKRWLRVVWNLISGVSPDNGMQIRSTTDVRTAFDFIDRLRGHHVHASLYALKDDFGDTEFAKRCREEKVKAIRILDDSSWEAKLVEAEETSFFKGAIRFLYRDASGNEDWVHFDEKFATAKRVAAIWETDKFLPLRNLIGRCSTEDEIKSVLYDGSNGAWMANLLNEKLIGPVDDFLTTYPGDWGLKIDPNSRFAEAVRDIVYSDLLAHLSVSQCKLREMYGLMALMPDNAKAEWKKFVVGHPRNAILSFRGNRFISEQKLAYCGHFWGWGVDFSYRDHLFRWKYSDKIVLLDKASKTEITSSVQPVDTAHFIEQLDRMIAAQPSSSSSTQNP